MLNEERRRSLKSLIHHSVFIIQVEGRRKGMGFVHLHLHTQYSLLDGANKIKHLMPQVQSYGMPAVAMTDHGNMFGAVEFYRAAAQQGIKPIIGCEIYLAPKSRYDRSPVRADDYEGGGNFHLILLAMNL